MSVVGVIGGGVSGLSTAYYLYKLGQSRIKQVFVFEAKDYFGGWIRTQRYPDGAVYELGPRSIRSAGRNGEQTLEMVDDLQLGSEIIPIVRGHPATRNRFLLFNNKLHPLPTGLSALFRISPPFRRPLVFYGLKDLFKRRIITEDDSMYNFAERRFGKEIADLVMDPMCRGIYAGDSKQISVKAIMPNLFEAEQKYGSVLKGIMKVSAAKRPPTTKNVTGLVKRAKEQHWAMWNFRNGLQCLPEELSARLKDAGVSIHTNSKCIRLGFTQEGVQITTNAQTNIQCDHVMAALPAHELAPLLQTTNAHLAETLASIPFVTVAVVILEYWGSVDSLVKHQAFGYLVPSCETSRVLGVTFDSCIFKEHDAKERTSTRLTVMLGGHWFEQLFGDPDAVNQADLLQVATETIQYNLGINATPVRHQILVHKKCIPQYKIGHFEEVNSMRRNIRESSLPLSLIGASYDGVAVNDCIESARKAVEVYLNS